VARQDHIVVEMAKVATRINELADRLADENLDAGQRSALEAELEQLGEVQRGFDAELESDRREQARRAEIKARYGTAWRRLGALILDSAALAPLHWLDQVVWNSAIQPLALASWAVLDTVAGVAYTVGFVAVCGQTPGKMACGVKIVDLEGGKVAAWQAVMREIVPLLVTPYFLFIQIKNVTAGRVANRGFDDMSSFAVFGWFVAGWTLLEVVTMLTNEKRRAVHDYIARTVVIRTDRRWGLIVVLLVLLVASWLISALYPDPNFAARR
jgi:uncharacterized RDD family membrane protein YckC